MDSPLGPIMTDMFMSNIELKLNQFLTNKSSLRFEIDIVFRKPSTLKCLFLPLQLIYRISCKDYDKHYYDETRREKSIRMDEHQADIRNWKQKSLVAQHVNQDNYTFGFNNVKY
ncbi:unnamed protein product [Didymodactylos carnosus]|uniref:Uncharacterized protein n=1 Tax=Didymodactylos carnosus TaxID=1234261 RepID=A0A813X0D7_9BILA|nr:unnamed protein product [Didymodactylos carnosus]CAF0864702.1 unnamed protein product [Didymodactylos carnosus]CAF3507845.1 unnamed protein product [Didymodactylos carnosus]CAF3652232.1 unnamed protein product [Didymodactylos carnosus]